MAEQVTNQEFSIEEEYVYDQSGPVRWIVSHLLRYRGLLLTFLIATLLSNALSPTIPLLIGAAFNEVLEPNPSRDRLLTIGLIVVGIVVIRLGASLVESFTSAVLGQHVEYDARKELFASLLGKSQTFHNRQQSGDIMSRFTNDIPRLNSMVSFGLSQTFISILHLIVPIIVIGTINLHLLLSPVVFVIGFVVTVVHYVRNLAPVTSEMQEQWGRVNAGLTETVVNVEVVKAATQEHQERRKFGKNIDRSRDIYVRQGRVQALYFPPLVLYVTLAAAFLHGIFLVSRGALLVGDLVAYMSLMLLFQYPTTAALVSLELLYYGLSGAGRIVEVLAAETELDENLDGHDGPMQGEVVFESVTFGYDDDPVLENVSFFADAGQTIAIVGQTGAGKSTLVELINRTYDVGEGRILVDGVNVRNWNLGSLRSGISAIEQDVFLFSRSIADNIAFGLGDEVDRAAIERAARGAQAHDFIMNFKDGYDTVVGESGATLSGGQRQRIAIARALLTDPRILILDDATSAIDSATEDAIQKAIRRVQEGRTTFLITYRLSQIRRADKILFAGRGSIIDQGTHEELIARCAGYRRIFAAYYEDRRVPEQPAYADSPVAVAPDGTQAGRQ